MLVTGILIIIVLTNEIAEGCKGHGIKGYPNPCSLVGTCGQRSFVDNLGLKEGSQ